jgi:hypothetical protein
LRCVEDLKTRSKDRGKRKQGIFSGSMTCYVKNNSVSGSSSVIAHIMATRGLYDR